LLMQSNYMDTG